MSIQAHPESTLRKQDILNIIQEDAALEILAETAYDLLIYDSQEGKELPVHFLEQMDATRLSAFFHISPDIPEKYHLNKDALARYLWNGCDKNAFVTMKEFLVIWSEPDDPETFEPSPFTDRELKRLAETYDEYALELAGDGLLGQLWYEQNIVIINLRNIADTSMEIARENADQYDPFFRFENLVLQGLLTTSVHELRHLQLDTNIFLSEAQYPPSLSAEDAVEQYCLEVYETHGVPQDILTFKEKRKACQSLSAKIQAVSTRIITSSSAHGSREDSRSL